MDQDDKVGYGPMFIVLFMSQGHFKFNIAWFTATSNQGAFHNRAKGASSTDRQHYFVNFSSQQSLSTLESS